MFGDFHFIRGDGICMMRRILRAGDDFGIPGMYHVEMVPSGEARVCEYLAWSGLADKDPYVCGEDWLPYYRDVEDDCRGYHLVFVLVGSDSFFAFRAKNSFDLDPLFKLGLEEITGQYISPPVVMEPSGWEYASYKSEAEQIRTRIARLTERLIEVGEKMREMERGE